MKTRRKREQLQPRSLILTIGAALSVRYGAMMIRVPSVDQEPRKSKGATCTFRSMYTARCHCSVVHSNSVVIMYMQIVALLASFAAAALVPPSQDPFYVPTGDWESAEEGSILAHREVPGALVNITYASAWQLLYRTQDGSGTPLAAVTTIIVPTDADYSKLLSYQVVYDTPDIDCSPSYAIQEGGIYIIDEGFMAGLQAGWIVNTPDYDRPYAAFTNGPISGRATLDSIRAALASTAITGVQADATVAMWGYSGGVCAPNLI